MTQAKKPPKVEPVTPDAMQRAAVHEQEIADEAAQIRDGATDLTPELFSALHPLLRRPIHPGHLLTISAGEGKPYPSTGIRSVQVQIDRMDNVLRPWWWYEHVEYQQEGKLCHVLIRVGNFTDSIQDANPSPTLFFREAWGGVDRANTRGNLMKGSYTNAAKLAFARVGVGHEVYVGATDFDPDVSEEAAAEQAKTDKPRATTIDAARAGDLRDKVDAILDPMDAETRTNFMGSLKILLGGMGVTGIKTFNTALLMKLKPEQADELDKWLAE